MPAIDLARLKTQAARLSEKFSQPEAFVHDLNELLEYYSNRTVRTAQIAQRLSVPTYRIPRPVQRQIESELTPLAQSHPLEAAALTKALWQAGSLESRLLAAHLLGSIPSAEAIPVLTRLPLWLGETSDKEIREALLTDALARVRWENPEAFFILLDSWLGSPRPVFQIWGLQALIALLEEPHFENLPAVFRILRPAVRAAGPITQTDLQTCLAALEKVSFTETLSFLRDILEDNPPALLLRTMRRILPAFSLKMQAALREILHEKGSQ